MQPETKAAARQWADVDSGGVQHLLLDAGARGWNAALDDFAQSNPFFVQRLRDTSLGNWHVILQKPRTGRSLDIGCGFGALLAGFARYYRTAFGAEMLPERLRFSAIRQEAGTTLPRPLARASGHQLPFRGASLDLVTMNGVLEWAAYYADGPARDRQLGFLREARRILAPGGTLAVAIENRYALETLVGMRDTHTGLRLIPAMPRRLAALAMMALNRRPYRTFLYSEHGYGRLFRAAGFETVSVLDLVSSYNDWDFVVNPHDAASYRFLWNAGWVRSFFRGTESIRRRLSRSAPHMLGHLGYAYLVLGGSVVTLLDTGHPLWQTLPVPPGAHRFAFRLREPAAVGVLTHDGSAPGHAVLLRPQDTATALTPSSPGLVRLLETMAPAHELSAGGVSITILEAKQ